MADDACARRDDAFQAWLKSAARFSNSRRDIKKTTAEHLSDLRRLEDYVDVDAAIATQFLKVTPPTAYASITTLVEAGILAQYRERSWGRVYVAAESRDIMEAAS
jgi:hypothetical protein